MFLSISIKFRFKINTNKKQGKAGNPDPTRWPHHACSGGQSHMEFTSRLALVELTKQSI